VATIEASRDYALPPARNSRGAIFLPLLRARHYSRRANNRSRLIARGILQTAGSGKTIDKLEGSRRVNFAPRLLHPPVWSFIALQPPLASSNFFPVSSLSPAPLAAFQRLRSYPKNFPRNSVWRGSPCLSAGASANSRFVSLTSHRSETDGLLFALLRRL